MCFRFPSFSFDSLGSPQYTPLLNASRVILTAILAFSLASTDQCVSSPGSSIDLFLRSHKNASGDWIITVETQRLTIEEDPREIVVKVQQETKVCGKKQIQQLVAVAVYPSLQDTSMPGAIEPATTRRTTTATSSTTATPFTTTTTATSSTTATPSTTTTTATSSTSTATSSTTSPRSCPPEYQPYPGHNCYKAFPDEYKTWSEARQQCIRDGGDLMVMDSEREREDVFLLLWNSPGWYNSPWLGVYIPQAGSDWTTVKGQPALSTWWEPGEPDGRAAWKCALVGRTGLLFNWDCTDTFNFICEISL